MFRFERSTYSDLRLKLWFQKKSTLLSWLYVLERKEKFISLFLCWAIASPGIEPQFIIRTTQIRRADQTQIREGEKTDHRHIRRRDQFITCRVGNLQCYPIEQFCRIESNSISPSNIYCPRALIWKLVQFCNQTIRCSFSGSVCVPPSSSPSSTPSNQSCPSLTLWKKTHFPPQTSLASPLPTSSWAMHSTTTTTINFGWSVTDKDFSKFSPPLFAADRPPVVRSRLEQQQQEVLNILYFQKFFLEIWLSR